MQAYQAMSDDIGKTVEVQRRNPANYANEQVYDTIDQIIDRNYPLHDIDRACCRALAH